MCVCVCLPYEEITVCHRLTNPVTEAFLLYRIVLLDLNSNGGQYTEYIVILQYYLYKCMILANVSCTVITCDIMIFSKVSRNMKFCFSRCVRNL